MRVLLVQTAFLGDIILSTPVVSAIKERCPDAEVWVVTTKAGEEALRHDPRIFKIVVFDKRSRDAGVSGLFNLAQELRRQDFSAAYSLHKSFRTALLLRLAKIPERIGFAGSSGHFLYTALRPVQGSHAVERHLSLIGEPEDLAAKHDLYLRACADSEVSEAHRSWAKSERRVLVAPGSAWKTKRWAREYYRELARGLTERGCSVAVVGGPSERHDCDFVAKDTGAVSFGGETSISQALWLVKNAGVLVCNDSGLLHAASAFKVPTAAIFCATAPEFGFGPWRNRAEVFGVEGLECRPCARHGGRRCPTGTLACTTGVRPGEVLAAVERLALGAPYGAVGAGLVI